VWEIPVGSRQSRGKPVVNLVSMRGDEEIAAIVPIREFAEDRYLFFATRMGVVKKTALSAYGNIRSVGLNAINIREGDTLIDVRITEGESEVILATRDGMAIRFNEADARSMGRATEGVRGINLRGDDVVVGMVPVREGSNLLVVTEKGMGKRTAVDAYRLQRRGGYGVINIKTSDKTGQVVAIKGVSDDEQLMLITRKGVVNRQKIDEIRTIGRATQGVRLMNLDKGDQVMDVARFISEDDEDEVAEGVLGEGGEGDAAGVEGRAEAGEAHEGADGGADEGVDEAVDEAGEADA
jgi:DNA gyrase subunit A